VAPEEDEEDGHSRELIQHIRGFLRHSDAIQACWRDASTGLVEGIAPIAGEAFQQRRSDGTVRYGPCMPHQVIGSVNIAALARAVTMVARDHHVSDNEEARAGPTRCSQRIAYLIT
jgi:hypothetical protein